MAITAFQIGEVAPGIGDLTGQGLSRDTFIASVLELLVQAGFERARYYEVAEDLVREERIVVLTHALPNQNGAARAPQFDFAHSSNERRGTGLFPAVETAVGEVPVDEPFVSELGLDGRSWVDVPVTAGEATVGLVSCDWSGPADQLCEPELNSLRAAGSLIGSHLGLKPIGALQSYRSAQARWIKKHPDALVIEAAEYIATAVDAATLAVFSFSWPDQTLTKMHEWIAPSLSGHSEEFRETYRVGQHLTGQAWNSDGLHHVVDFASLKERGSPLLEPKSLARHTDLLGDVRTAAYASVGQLDRRYLIRLMNRASRPDLPFLSEAALLDTLISELSSEIDAAAANQRTASLQEVARLATETTEPAKVAANINDVLGTEYVKHFGTLCHQYDAVQFGFGTFRGRRFRDYEYDLSCEWQADALYIAATESDGVYRLKEFAGRSPLAAALLERNFQALLSFAIHAGQTRGAFFVPVDVALPTTKDSLSAELSYGTLSLLRACALEVANAVETRTAQSRVDGARRALGLIGHELRGPLSTANSEAELAVNMARRVLREIYGDDFHSRRDYRNLMQHLNAMWDRQRQVSVALELAPLVAQESEGELQLHFDAHQLSLLVKDAVKLVEDEVATDGHGRRYTFVLAPSARRLGAVVCDADFVRHVLKNVLRNAVKYSLPRHRGAPMEIEIIGEPQSHHVGIKVRNWGLGIPEERRDLIFQPWVRGDIKDDVKAIRGMGLGLFLARRILSAHDGAIMFVSRPTLDDPKRREKLEGYETTFEIRLPRSLTPGTHTFRWADTGSRPINQPS